MVVENFEGDVAGHHGCAPPQNRADIALCPVHDPDRFTPDLRTIGRAAGLQRVREQFDPILSPEYLAVEHIDRRAEHVGRQRILAVLLIGRADLVGARTLHQLLAGKSGIVGHFGQRRGIGQIELVFPHGRKGPPQEWIGIVAGLDRRDHDAVGQPRVERPVRRLQMEFQAALVAPALQFDHPVALPHRMALHQRQAAGFGKQIDQHHRLVIHLEIVGSRPLAKRLVPDIGPRRLKAKNSNRPDAACGLRDG